MKSLRCPPAETHSHLGLHAISEGNDHVKVIVNNLSLHLTVSFLTNRQEILDSSNRIQLPILENILNMQADILLRGIVNFRQLILSYGVPAPLLNDFVHNHLLLSYNLPVTIPICSDSSNDRSFL